MAKMKRLLAPKFWRVPKKVKKWVVAPKPGPHKKFESIPLQIVVRDVLKLVDTGKEAKSIIKQGEVLVDSNPRKDHAYPVGLFDVIAIPKVKQFYRAVPVSNGLTLVKISEKEANLKICKINNKTLQKKGKLQLNLHDGKNILADKDNYKTGDSLLIELPSCKIIQHIPLTTDSLGIVSKGVDSGKIGRVKEILKGGAREPARIVCDLDGVKEEVLKDRFFVIGKDKSLITVE